MVLNGSISLHRTYEVLDEGYLRTALIRLNPGIAGRNELANEIIYKLRAIFISVNQTGLIKAKE